MLLHRYGGAYVRGQRAWRLDEHVEPNGARALHCATALVMVLVLVACITQSWHAPVKAVRAVRIVRTVQTVRAVEAAASVFGPKTLEEVARTPSAVAQARRAEAVRTMGFRPPTTPTTRKKKTGATHSTVISPPTAGPRGVRVQELQDEHHD
jgi:hypothetical protein